MNVIEQILLAITYFNLKGNAWNILGVLWLVALCFFFTRRLMAHFNKGYFPQPETNPRSHIWIMAVILFAFLLTMLFQMMVDDMITTPINLCFGSWRLLAPHLGEFTVYKLFRFKVDVYLIMITYSLVFTWLNLWQFFHFTKYSAILLTATVLFQIFLGSQQIFYFLNLSGYERLLTFWVSYPWFRILTGLFAASLIKKPGENSIEQELTLWDHGQI